MRIIKQKIASIDWQMIKTEMNEKGFALIPKLLPEAECEELILNYQNPDRYRKTITMERYRFGLGEYKYFNYPLPGLIQTIRKEIYSKLAPIANAWMNVLHIETKFPDEFDDLQKLCHDHNQTKPTVLI